MKYIFLDIDMTLYSPVLGDTPQSAREAIRQARENGSKVFLCTGRSLAECAKYLGYDVDGFIFGAGSMIYADKKRIYDHPLNKEDDKKLRKIIQDAGLGYAAEGSAGAYADEMGYAIVSRYFNGGDGTKEELVKSAMANGCYPEIYEHPDDSVYKICAFTKEKDYDFEQLRKQLPDPYELTVTIRDPKFHEGCEITDGRITKATGIQRVLEYYGSDMTQAVAIGDSENDISMLKACGMGIAMGNAFEHVKEVADYVTTDILDDGIKNAFQYIGVI